MSSADDSDFEAECEMAEGRLTAAQQGTIRDIFERLVPMAQDQRDAAIADFCPDAPEIRAEVRNLLWLHDCADDVMTELGMDASPASSEWERLSRIARKMRGNPSPILRTILDSGKEPSKSRQNVLNSLRLFDDTGAEPPRSDKTDSDPMLNRQIGRYRIVEHIGTGGMGVVYRAIDEKLGRSVALKFLPSYLSRDRGARDRLEQEARAASALDHPNIAYVHEVAEADDGRLYIAMAYYEGETLDRRIDDGPLPADEAIEIACQVAQGLAAAHEKGIVHRDIKPANILLTRTGLVKILDFGIAKRPDVSMTQHGQRLGTAAYMSPEQARGQETDQRTDIWSLGVVLYEMLTGDRPFKGAYEAAVVYSLMNTPHGSLRDVLPDLPAGVEQIVDRCLAKPRDDRFERMSDVHEALSRILDRPTDQVNPVAALPRRRILSRSWFIGGGGIVLLIAMLSIGIWMRGSVPDQRHLAVLPFEIIGVADDGEALSAGVVQTLTSKLTQLEQFEAPLWVVPASEIPPGMTAGDARDRFGVTLVVSGSVQFEDERIRLTLNLIDARTRRQLGSEQIDYQRSSSLALQDEAALRLADMLRVRMQPEARATLVAGGTRNREANMLYLRGWGYLRGRDRQEDLDRAILLFEESTEMDTSFALAYAGLGEAYWQKYRLTEDVSLVSQAVQNSLRALDINPDLAPVHVTLGTIQAGMGQFAEAHASFRRALEIDPNNAEGFRQLAGAYRTEGLYDEAERTYRRTIELKPDYWQGYRSLGAFLASRGRFEEAVEAFRRGLELAPSNQTLLLNTATMYWHMMRLEEAVEMIERILEVYPDFTQARSNLATAYFYTGRFADAARLYEQDLAANPNDYAVQGYLADALHWMGDRDRAHDGHRLALELAQAHLAVRGHDPDLIGGMAGYFAHLGEVDSARTYLDRIEQLTTPADADVGVAFGVGEVYETLGEREEALRWMRPALDSGYGWMQINFSPWLRELRADPVIAELMDQQAETG